MKKRTKFILFISLFVLLVGFFALYIIKNARIRIGDEKTTILDKNLLNKVEITTIKDVELINQIKLTKKKTVVLFWASWCIPCKKEMKVIKNLTEKYNTDLKLVSIDRNNEKQLELVKSELYSFGFNKAYIFDYKLGLDFNNEKAFSDFTKNNLKSTIEGIPKTVLFDEKGNLLICQTGYNRDDSLAAYNSLDSLLNYYY